MRYCLPSCSLLMFCQRIAVRTQLIQVLLSSGVGEATASAALACAAAVAVATALAAILLALHVSLPSVLKSHKLVTKLRVRNIWMAQLCLLLVRPPRLFVSHRGLEIEKLMQRGAARAVPYHHAPTFCTSRTCVDQPEPDAPSEHV